MQKHFYFLTFGSVHAFGNNQMQKINQVGTKSILTLRNEIYTMHKIDR